MTYPLTVLILSADPLARAALTASLETPNESLTVVATSFELELAQPQAKAESTDSTIEDLLDLHDPDLILYDLGWQDSIELPAVGGWGLPVLALVSSAEGAQAAWQAGVMGCLSRDSQPEQLVTALEALANGLVVSEQAYLAFGALADLSTLRPEPLQEPLTEREHDVLVLLAEGLTNRAIAIQLNISDHTVKFHVNALLSKLSAQSRTEAAVKATRLGLLHL